MNQYEVIDVIATGGMGVVYKARHTLTDRIVAIKLLPSELAREVTNVDRLKLEAKALAQLNHPNIVTTFDFGFSSLQEPFIVIEYVDGESLKEIIERDGVVPVEIAVPLFVQIVDAMRFAHANKILHRDLKPHNIMVTNSPQNDHVKVLDFGVAKMIEEAQAITRTGEVVGSPLYMSPEQCIGKAYDQRCDIYSVGVVMYETLTGVVPYRGDNYISTVHLKCTKLAPSFSDVAPGRVYPKELEMIVLRCLEVEPEKRFASMLDLKEELEEVQRSLPKVDRSKALAQSRNSGVLSVGSPVLSPAAEVVSKGPVGTEARAEAKLPPPLPVPAQAFQSNPVLEAHPREAETTEATPPSVNPPAAQGNNQGTGGGAVHQAPNHEVSAFAPGNTSNRGDDSGVSSVSSTSSVSGTSPSVPNEMAWNASWAVPMDETWNRAPVVNDREALEPRSNKQDSDRVPSPAPASPSSPSASPSPASATPPATSAQTADPFAGSAPSAVPTQGPDGEPVLPAPLVQPFRGARKSEPQPWGPVKSHPKNSAQGLPQETFGPSTKQAGSDLASLSAILEASTVQSSSGAPVPTYSLPPGNSIPVSGDNRSATEHELAQGMRLALDQGPSQANSASQQSPQSANQTVDQAASPAQLSPGAGYVGQSAEPAGNTPAGAGPVRSGNVEFVQPLRDSASRHRFGSNPWAEDGGEASLGTTNQAEAPGSSASVAPQNIDMPSPAQAEVSLSVPAETPPPVKAGFAAPTETPPSLKAELSLPVPAEMPPPVRAEASVPWQAGMPPLMQAELSLPAQAETSPPGPASPSGPAQPEAQPSTTYSGDGARSPHASEPKNSWLKESQAWQSEPIDAFAATVVSQPKGPSNFTNNYSTTTQGSGGIGVPHRDFSPEQVEGMSPPVMPASNRRNWRRMRGEEEPSQEEVYEEDNDRSPSSLRAGSIMRGGSSDAREKKGIPLAAVAAGVVIVLGVAGGGIFMLAQHKTPSAAAVQSSSTSGAGPLVNGSNSPEEKGVKANNAQLKAAAKPAGKPSASSSKISQPNHLSSAVNTPSPGTANKTSINKPSGSVLSGAKSPQAHGVASGATPAAGGDRLSTQSLPQAGAHAIQGSSARPNAIAGQASLAGSQAASSVKNTPAAAQQKAQAVQPGPNSLAPTGGDAGVVASRSEPARTKAKKKKKPPHKQAVAKAPEAPAPEAPKRRRAYSTVQSYYGVDGD